MFLPLVTATNQNPELGIANYPCSQEDLSISSLHPYRRCQQPKKTGVHAKCPGPSLPPSTTPTCRQIGNRGKPEAAESHSAPPFDHRLIIGRPPSSQASLPGRQETEVGHQLRRLTCLKPHQDIWDRPWKPQREPTGSQARFSSLVIQVRFLDLKVRLVTFIYAVKVRRYLIQ
ncbi:hypothetical protein MHYP_G00045050 [Metynnis hypsauchen]